MWRALPVARVARAYPRTSIALEPGSSNNAMTRPKRIRISARIQKKTGDAEPSSRRALRSVSSASKKDAFARQHIEAHLLVEETNQAVYGEHYSDVVRAAEQNESRDGRVAQGTQIGETLIPGIDSSERNCVFPMGRPYRRSVRQFLRRGPRGIGRGEELVRLLPPRTWPTEKGPLVGIILRPHKISQTWPGAPDSRG